ncbi:unnamed protein product [Victoria cruziana]
MRMGYAILASGDLWIKKLLKVTFFADCSIHGLVKKNLFCIHCGASLCSQCALKHSSHPLIQIRRYLYNDVVRLEDMRNLVDCSHVQRYIVNGYQAVFLNRQARTGQLKDIDNCCRTCKKMLQHAYHYCSIACKAEAMPGQLVQQAKGTCMLNYPSPIASSKVTEISDDGDICTPRIQSFIPRRKKGIPKRSPMF